MMRGSILGQGMTAAAGTFLSGMNTYLMKIGPSNLGGYAAPIDKSIAASPPLLAMRLRLQDVVELESERLRDLLSARPTAPCHLINLGGASAIDSLNALLVLQKTAPDVLRGRRVEILVLDLVKAGPSFGARALAALRGSDGPLRDVDIRFTHRPYDWNRTDELPRVLHDVPADGVVAISSEGALFEYASDDAVVDNLEALRSNTPLDSFVVGSVTRDDGAAKYLYAASRVPLKPRSRAQFEELVHRAGWRIARLIERPFSRNVRLQRP